MNICTKISHSPVPMMAKRYTHRAPDVKFLQQGQDQSKIEVMSSYPQLMENLFKTSAAMVIQDKVPFVHGQSPALGAIRIFMNALVKPSQKGFYQYMRQPSAIYQIERQELCDRVEQFIEDNGDYVGRYPEPSRLDQHPSLRSHLVSVGYAMTSNFAYMESAYSFTFMHPVLMGNIEEIFAQVIGFSMRTRGHSDKIPRVMKQMRPIFEEYQRLPIGDLIIIGVPKEKLEEYVYDSKAFGIPTGKKVQDIVERPFESPERFSEEEGGLQARIMLYKETMTPSCGIDVVYAGDDRQVDAYCHGMDLTEPRELKVFEPILYRKRTAIEEDQRRKRQDLSEKVIAVVQNLE